ncbi:uncharacterized protein LOC122244339 [Penaeus japonicus]|uniref:uncharacterized protein LOC122244339 n=1 Tax=Penaeus japonicus TaxID=27405 RepID=UPI001C713CB6|nr:uncharacterized protein LOC122244339 [Penaeus japonicus]
MHSFVVILAWAAVGGAWAWSSSEVSCASCGSECQDACGTRNFRACCFNFQRRRRAESLPHSVLSGEGMDSVSLQGLLRQMMDGSQNPRLPQALRPVPRALDVSDHGAADFRETPSLSSIMSSLLQESSEEEGDEDAAVVADGRADENDGAAGLGDALGLSRLVAVGVRRPPAPAAAVAAAARHAGPPRLLFRQPLRLRYPPSTSRK